MNKPTQLPEYGARWQASAKQFAVDADALEKQRNVINAGNVSIQVQSQRNPSNVVDADEIATRWLREEQKNGRYLHYRVVRAEPVSIAAPDTRRAELLLRDALKQIANLSARLDACEKFIHNVRVVYFLDGGKDTEFLQRLLGEVE